jgi:hypothetical protein
MREEEIKDTLKEIRELRLENERLKNAIREVNSRIAYMKNSRNIDS